MTRVCGLIVFTLWSISAWAQNPDVPFRFEENLGQDTSGARYIGRGAGYRTDMRSNEVVIRGPGGVVQMRFSGGGAVPAIDPLDEMTAKTQTYDSERGRFYDGIRN